MSKLRLPSRKTRNRLVLNSIMIMILVIAMAPIALTVIISFKDQQDTIRKPSVLFPCDTETDLFDLAACRWAGQSQDSKRSRAAAVISRKIR